MTKRALLILVASFAVWMMQPRSALALVVKTLPSIGGVAYVGMVGSSAKIVFHPYAGGACTVITISASGLSDNTEIHGSAADDYIEVIPFNTSVCGLSMSPVITNGHALRILGKGGNDNIYGGFAANAYGNDGHDWVGTDGTGASAYGNAGDDFVWSGTVSVSLHGDAGNDWLCAYIEPQPVVYAMYGGSGTDDRCGYGIYGNFSVETSGNSCFLCNSFTPGD